MWENCFGTIAEGIAVPIDVSNWHFEYQNATPIQKALCIQNLSAIANPKVFDFPDANSLLQHLDGPGDGDRSRFQSSVSDRLRKDPNVRAIIKKRTLLKNLRHFPSYRSKQYNIYHDSAHRVMDGTATDRDKQLVDGLDMEIAASKILLDSGQLLFHGRCNEQILRPSPYPSFVSTTLDPIVAPNSAYRRAGIHFANGRPIIFILKLSGPLRALWGHVGKSKEWELLLPRRLCWRETDRSSGNTFDIVHATAC
jgi:hypothetical protein